jgi:hypothetical protein
MSPSLQLPTLSLEMPKSPKLLSNRKSFNSIPWCLEDLQYALDRCCVKYSQDAAFLSAQDLGST